MRTESNGWEWVEHENGSLTHDEFCGPWTKDRQIRLKECERKAWTRATNNIFLDAFFPEGG